MIRFNLILTLVLTLSSLKAQVVTTNPAIPIDSKAVTITFNADEGTGGLKDFSEDIWAHTGLITNQSTSDSDWKNVKADWTENIDACKLTRVSGTTNQYTLTISPNIRAFYNVAAGVEIRKLAFVFRNNDGSKEGKDIGGTNILVNVSTNVLTVSFSSPENFSIYKSGENVEVEVNAIQNDSIQLYVNDIRVKTSNLSSLNYTISNVQLDEYRLKTIAYSGTSSVEDERVFYTRGSVIEEQRPSNLRRGVNVVSNTSVTVLLFAPEKEFVYLVGDFNNWQPKNDYLMKKDGDYFWLTLSNLDANAEYAYQYWFDNNLKIADPYTTKVLDPWNDKYIPASTYPNLLPYPNGKTDEIVSVLSTQVNDFNWQVKDFDVPGVDSLVIYELLIRDFSDNGTIKTITDSIAYFKRLGINVIELMPFNEFEGNDSWGYNPSFYFATDKAYGTDNDYKEFIDVCHQNGIAVLMDMVLNHSFGQSTFARMYLEGGKPASNNPWYNREHNMANTDAQWGHDFNHESVHTKQLVDSICSFWLTEFKIDGFRFDFTKGFTNTPYGVGDWASAYDHSRIRILKRMTDKIREVKSDAIISFEHLSDNSEEKELSEYGILLWGNQNHSFNEATMGYNSSTKSDFSWASYLNRGWTKPHIINYMESHDEERLMYKNNLYGNVNEGYDVKDVKIGLQRSATAAAMLFSIPGPSMIWQFGELGYDYSINYCSDGSVDGACRTHRKPVNWDYQKDEDRMKVYDTYAKMIHLKKTEPVFSTSDFNLSVRTSVKRIELNSPEMDVRVIANFGLESAPAIPKYTSKGWWYNHFSGDSINVTDLESTYSIPAGEFVVLSSKKLNGFVKSNKVANANVKVLLGPNPSSDNIAINPLDSGVNHVKVINTSGRVISEFPIEDSLSTYDISYIKPGIYLFQFLTSSSTSTVFKFIKM